MRKVEVGISIVVFFYSLQLVETVGTGVTVLENVMSKVAHLESVKLYVTDDMKKGVDFDLIRSAGCSLHCQGAENGIVRSVRWILIPWKESVDEYSY
jgi:hypothetical protein